MSSRHKQPPPEQPRTWKYTSLIAGDPFAIARSAQAMCGAAWRYRPNRNFEDGEFSCDSEQAMDEMKRLYPLVERDG